MTTRKRLRKREQKKIAKDCWSLNIATLSWLKPRLEKYLKDAGNFIDLSFYTFEYKEHTYTEEALIKRMLVLIDKIETSYYEVPKAEIEAWKDEFFDLWKMVFFCLWW